MEEKEIYSRYKTQMKIAGFGVEAQRRLRAAKVLIIGCGGLGCPCIQYLVAAGVGRIGICDGDVVDLSNLHRQILFGTDDVGEKKTSVIKAKMECLNPTVMISPYAYFLDNQKAMELFPQYDLIIDCTDDIQIRFLINDACVLLQKPLVYGAVFQMEGQVAVLNSDEKKVNLRDLFHALNSSDVTTCSESGTLGVVTGMTGTLQALEAIKWITKMDGLLQNEMLISNYINNTNYKVNIPRSENGKQYPQTKQAFLNKKYGQLCKNSAYTNHALNQHDFLQKIKTEDVQVIDVRNQKELPVVDFFEYENIPLNDLLKYPDKVDRHKTILLFCHAGIRSQTALDFLMEECSHTEVYHLKGGILKWNFYE